jgi:hypothetical protein
MRRRLSRHRPVHRQARLVVAQPFVQTELRTLGVRISGRRGGLRDVRSVALDDDSNGRPGGDARFVFEIFSCPRG